MARLLVAAIVVIVYLSSVGTSSSQQADELLRLALVIPVATPPLYSSDSTRAPDAAARVTELADALDALRSAELDDVPFALAPSPVLCDELQLFRREGRRLERTLGDLSSRRRLYTRLVTAPYAEVRLPDLSSSASVIDEVRAGTGRLGECGAPNRNVLYPPDLTLDNETIDAAAKAGVTVIFASADRVPRGPTRTQGVILVPTSTVSRDDTPNDAFLRLEGFERAVALIPPRADLATFISSLANDPRIELVTIRDLVAEPTTRFVAFPTQTSPPPSYRRALASADAAWQRLRSFTRPLDRFTALVRTSLARARSSAEWNGDWSVGRARARAVVRVVERQQRLVSSAQGSVTFTSQRGSVPVTVSNRTVFPVRVRVELSSPKLEFPDGATRVVTIDPPGDTVVFAALAKSTGTFPVQVRLASPNGHVRFGGGELTVRSTAANVPALALTAGGAIFLAGWYIRHLRRRRRERVTLA